MKMIEHILKYARAYMSGLTSVATLALAYGTNLTDWEKVTLGVIVALGSFVATAVLPSKANGVTIAEAVTMDGTALAQATALLKDVPLPGSAEKVVSGITQVAIQAENLGSMVPPETPPAP